MWLKLTSVIDRLIDGISMYRLLLYYLIGLLLIATGLSAFNILHFNPVYIVSSAIILSLACWLINKIIAGFFSIPINPESSILTGLIIALIIPPVPFGSGFLFMLAAAGLAMASKYFLEIKRKHIFNPAAIAVVLTGIGAHQYADWWVGTACLLPFIIIGGLLIVRKAQRGMMVGSYLLATILATAFFSTSISHLGSNLVYLVLTSPAIFLGFVMLTEPYTSPAQKKWQFIYAIIVGVILAPQTHFGTFYPTPEIALVIGNIFAYLVNPKIKFLLHQKRRLRLSSDSYEFEYALSHPMKFKPGQYLEFTLNHPQCDSRGARRYFTISSSPTDPNLKIGVKLYNKGSSFKTAMYQDPGHIIVASQLAGDFTLPDDPNQKLVFVAGGIGITPFISMIRYLVATGQRRNIVLLYGASKQEDLAYSELLDQQIERSFIRIFYALTNAPEKPRVHYYPGRISSELISRAVPDIDDRKFFISGSHSMVEDTEQNLHKLGVKRANIKVDFFPGYR